MAEQPAFARLQRAFAAHIRDPEHSPGPADVEDRRMAIYRDLFFNNVESLLATNFPVLRRLLPDAHWRGMVRDFFVRHRCETPFFPELAQEFLDYLRNERSTDPEDPPFLLELAHYEWVELALGISDDEPDLAAVDPNGDLMDGRPLVSPLAWSLTYRFPVHRIDPDHRPKAPGAEPTRLLVYRNRADEVEFMEVNAVTQRLLELIGEHPDWTGRRAVERIAEELRHPEPAQVLGAGAALLLDLRRRNVILGIRRDPS